MRVKARGASPAKDILRIVEAIEKSADGIRLVTFNTVKGQFTRRIFNTAQSSDGSAIGSYQPLTKKIRQAAGRRTDKVDLEMTGTLRRSINVGTSEGRIVMGMLDQPEPEITVEKGRIVVTGTSKFGTVDNAVSQEKRFSKEIFAPSKEELTRGEKTVIKEINRVVKNALKSS